MSFVTVYLHVDEFSEEAFLQNINNAEQEEEKLTRAVLKQTNIQDIIVRIWWLSVDSNVLPSLL
jgi:hypothetical protein